MIEVIQSALSLIVTLGILVTIHEFGHYWVARKCGVKVLRFSVGFGKPVYSWYNKSGTEFAIASIPLGGYVKMLDEREGDVPENQKPFAFNQKTAGQRIAIAMAGPVANFIFAIFAYWLMFLSGFNVLIPTIGSVEPDSIAERAGLTQGYEIVAIDGRETPGWRAVSMELVNRIGDTGTIEVRASAVAGASPEVFSLAINDWLLNNNRSDLLPGLGIHSYRPPIPAVMGEIKADSPAMQGGLRTGDRVVSVGEIEISDWFGFVDIIQKSAEKPLRVGVFRKNTKTDSEEEQFLYLDLTPGVHVNEDGVQSGRLGVGVAPFKFPPEMIREVSYGPFDAVKYAVGQTSADVTMTLNAIKKMFLGLISLDNLSGPITIAQIASDSISSGTEDFLRFLALLSVSLGILNLLPIPVLDGGHILYYVFEVLRGKPLAEKWQLVGLKIGMTLILLLMTLAFYNDVMRLQ